VARTSLSAASLDFNPYSRRHHADPYPAYAKLRAEAPLARNDRFGFWMLSRYDDVLAALKDWKTFSSAQGITLQPFAGLRPMIILMDPPAQKRIRGILLKAFTPRRIVALEPRIRAIARELVSDLRAEIETFGSCDFVRAFAAPYPTTVIAELLGVDARDRGQFKAWSDQIMTSASPEAASLERAYDEIFAYFERVVAERRRHPGPDLVSALVAAEEEGKRLSEDELLGFCALLLIAGNETMTNFLGNAMLTLHRHPEARRELADNPALLPSAVDELLRFEPPVHELARTVTRDVELHGETLREGDRVLLLLASANRDERRFADAGRLDLRRDPNPHLSFGFGIHFCMGASLARMEAAVALGELLASTPEHRVLGEQVEWFRTPAVRGPARLELGLDPMG
jgi:cytochrome P450